MKKFLTTPLGSFLKGFVSVLLLMYFKEIFKSGNIFIPITKDLINNIVIAALAPNLQIMLNWYNSEYKNYGVGSKLDDNDQDGISGPSGLITVLIFFIVLTAMVSACNP